MRTSPFIKEDLFGVGVQHLFAAGGGEGVADGRGRLLDRRISPSIYAYQSIYLRVSVHLLREPVHLKRLSVHLSAQTFLVSAPSIFSPRVVARG